MLKELRLTICYPHPHLEKLVLCTMYLNVGVVSVIIYTDCLFVRNQLIYQVT